MAAIVVDQPKWSKFIFDMCDIDKGDSRERGGNRGSRCPSAKVDLRGIRESGVALGAKDSDTTANLCDRFAIGLVKAMRFVADAFFAKRYGPRPVVLDTVAAVPGIVGGLLPHLG